MLFFASEKDSGELHPAVVPYPQMPDFNFYLLIFSALDLLNEYRPSKPEKSRKGNETQLEELRKEKKTLKSLVEKNQSSSMDCE